MKMHNSKKTIFPTAFYVVFVLSNCAVGQNRDLALYALNQCKKTQKWHEKFSVHVSATFREIFPAKERESSTGLDVTIKKLGSCNLKISSLITPKKMAADSQITQIVVNNKTGVALGHDVKKQPDGANVTAKPETMLNRYIGDIFYGSALDGFVSDSDGKSLLDIMSEAEDLSYLGKEVINGYSCQKISSNTKYGKVELWMDENNGYLLRKYILSKGPDSLCNGGKKLRESNKYGVGEGALKGVSVNSWSCVLDQVEIVKQSGFLFPKSGRLIVTHSRSNGQHFSGEHTYKRTEFDPNPDLSEYLISAST